MLDDNIAARAEIIQTFATQGLFSDNGA